MIGPETPVYTQCSSVVKGSNLLKGHAFNFHLHVDCEQSLDVFLLRHRRMRGHYFSFLLTVGGSEERRTTACGLIFTWRLSKFVVGFLV